MGSVNTYIEHFIVRMSIRVVLASLLFFFFFEKKDITISRLVTKKGKKLVEGRNNVYRVQKIATYA